MAQDIESAGYHLFYRYTVRVNRIHQCKFGIELRVIPAGFYLLFLVGDHCAAIAFAAGARHGDNHPQRDRFHLDHSRMHPEIFPDIALVPRRKRYRLTAVHH